jgi:hypothetical protein
MSTAAATVAALAASPEHPPPPATEAVAQQTKLPDHDQHSKELAPSLDIPVAALAEQDSDWEDDQFTYNSIGVDEMPPGLTELIHQAAAEVEGLQQQQQHGAKDRNDNTAAAAPASPKPGLRLGLGKNKFKPNLFTDRRARNTSGPRATVLAPRARTISTGSGTDSETEAPRSPAPLLRSPRPSAPLLEGLLQPRARARRVTETRGEKERSQFMRRKQEHKRRFLRGVPERGNMTMFDLIYYNPENGPRMSIEEEDQQKADSPGDTADLVPPPAEVQDAEPDTPPETPPAAGGDGMPCPQVKVGVNGEIILDDTSLVLETTEAKKAKDFMLTAPVAVVETAKTTATNYGTWSKKRRHVDWSEKETLKFYKALSVVGSDFSMMESVFKKRTRQELKLKFKKEERVNGKMVDKCLRERGMYTELEGIMEDSEEDSDAEEEKTEEKVKKRLPKKRGRGRYKNQGYYDSSSGGEEADPETSRSPARKRVREVVRVRGRRPEARQPLVVPGQSPRAAAPPALPPTHHRAAPIALAGSLSGVQFPPGLLAANPGLVGAKPGSLVVVASPSKTDPGSQLLHVYMVSGRQPEAGPGSVQDGRDRSRSPRVPTSPRHRAPSPCLTLDPAVVRAVDRSRLAGQAGGARSRAVSECEDSTGGQSVGSRGPEGGRGPEGRQGPRQRTCSEGAATSDLRTELVRQRFLAKTST